MELHEILTEDVKGEAVRQLSGLMSTAGDSMLEQIAMEEGVHDDWIEKVAIAKADYEEAVAIFMAEGPGPSDVNKDIMDNYRSSLMHLFDSSRLSKEKEKRERFKAVMLAGLQGAFEVSKVVAKSYLSSQLGVKL